jgi:hypothetical protein
VGIKAEGPPVALGGAGSGASDGLNCPSAKTSLAVSDDAATLLRSARP